MNKNSLVSISDISKEEMLQLLEVARYFEENPNHKILDGRVVACAITLRGRRAMPPR